MANAAGHVPDDLAVNRLQMMAHCDEAQARFLLEAAGGNLELALQMAIENSDLGEAYAEHNRVSEAAVGGFGFPPPPQPHQHAPGAGGAAFGGPTPPRPRAPAAPRGGGGAAAGAVLATPLSLLGFVLRVPLMALGFGFRVMRFTVVNSVHAAAVAGDRVLPPRLMRAARSVAAAIAAGVGAGGEELDPAGQAAAFVETFKAAYGDRHPRWQESGWRVACQQARREFRFLFVYLHSPEHEDTGAFCRTVLTCPDVVDYVNANFVSWGGDVTAGDAFVLSQQTQMGVTRFPYAALLSMAPSDNRVQLVAAASGPEVADPAALLTLMRGAVANFGALLAAQRAEVEEREFARRLVEEQDAEYEASLAADRRREAERAEERRRQEEEEQRRQEEERRAREAAEAEAARLAEAEAAVERRREAARAALLPEPPAGISAEGSAAIRLRLPDGTHTSRTFPQGATLQAVFDFVDSLDATSYSRYHLVANYPRRVFVRAAHGSASLRELGLVSQAALFVQPEE